MFLRKNTSIFFLVASLLSLALYFVSLQINCTNCVGIFNPYMQFIGDGGDTYEFFGFQYMVRDNLMHLRFPFAFSTMLHYPVGFEFGFGFEGVFHSMAGGILSLFLHPVLSYNLTIFLILFVNIFVSSFCFLRIGEICNPKGDRSLLAFKSILAAVIFGYSIFIIVRMNGHLNLALVAGFPVLVMAMFEVCEKIKKKTPLCVLDVVWFPLSLFILAIGSLEYVVFGFFVLLPFPFLLMRMPENTVDALLTFSTKKNLWAAFVWYLLFLALFLFLFKGFFYAIFSGQMYIPKRTVSPIDLKNVLLNLFAPNTYQGPLWKLLNFHKGGITSSIFLGYSAISIFFAFFLFSSKKHWKIFAAICFSYICLLLSGLLRYPIISQTLRFYIFLLLLISIVFVIDDYFKKKFAYIVLGLLLIERLLIASQITPPLNEALLRKVRELPGKAVMVAPMSPYTTVHSALPYYFGKSVMDGNVHWTALTKKTLTFINDPGLKFFKCEAEPPTDSEAVLQRLKDIDVRIIYFERFARKSWTKENCQALMLWLESLDREKRIRIVAKDEWQEIYIIP